MYFYDVQGTLYLVRCTMYEYIVHRTCFLWVSSLVLARAGRRELRRWRSSIPVGSCIGCRPVGEAKTRQRKKKNGESLATRTVWAYRNYKNNHRALRFRGPFSHFIRSDQGCSGKRSGLLSEPPQAVRCCYLTHHRLALLSTGGNTQVSLSLAA